MKSERPIDPKLRLEARRLRQRLMGQARTPEARQASLAELWLDELSALTGKARPLSSKKPAC